MPELPEVECCRRALLPIVRGRAIEDVKASASKHVFLTPPHEMARGLRGCRITGIDRKGKYLLFRLSKPSRTAQKPPHGATLLVHLGMTGQLFSRAYAPDKHVHMTMRLAGAKHLLYFRDARQFGKILLLAPKEEASNARLEKLGVDGLEVRGEHLWRETRGRAAAIKALLLDQSSVAGVGNIYADEALFAAGVRPSRKAGRVTRDECERLAAAIRTVLTRAVELGGSSISDYIHPDGSPGYFQIEHRVYGRTGRPCVTCGAPIKRVVIGQRSAHWCATCQK